MREETKTTVSKNKTAKVGEKYSYKYVDIAQIHEYLEENNMRYYQYIDRIDNDDYIITVPIVDGKELTPRRGCRVVDATLIGVNNPAQQQGSALTYARRYSLLMAFGLATEDDDAASLTQKKEVTEKEAKEYVFAFGKHKGKKLVDLVDKEDGYIDWLLNNSKDEYLLKCIELLTGQVPLSEEELEETVNLMAKINELMVEKNITPEKIRETYNVKSSKDMTEDQLRNCVDWLISIENVPFDD